MKTQAHNAEWMRRAAVLAVITFACAPACWAFSGQRHGSLARPAARYGAQRSQAPKNRPNKQQNQARQVPQYQVRPQGNGIERQAPNDGAQRPAYPVAPNRAPAYTTAPYGAQARPGYASPEYSKPGYSKPGYSNPGYSNPGYSNPRYTSPGSANSGAAPPGHLGDWLNQHRGQPIQEQERTLRNDPSFNRLPAADQQRLLQQLHQVNQLPEDQRERRLARSEMLERMSPQDRMRLNMSGRRLAALPPDRQALVKNAFRDLRAVPLDQRQMVLNSSRYQGVFSPEERGILSDFLRAEPYQPAR